MAPGTAVQRTTNSDMMMSTHFVQEILSEYSTWDPTSLYDPDNIAHLGSKDFKNSIPE